MDDLYKSEIKDSNNNDTVKTKETKNRNFIKAGFSFLIIILFLTWCTQTMNRSAKQTVDQNTLSSNMPQGVVSVDFKQFDKDFNALTDLQKDEKWPTLKGKDVQWTGKIENVTSTTITITTNVFGAVDFKANITTEDQNKLSTLNKGSQLTLQGTLSARSPWTLNNAKIVK